MWWCCGLLSSNETWHTSINNVILSASWVMTYCVCVWVLAVSAVITEHGVTWHWWLVAGQWHWVYCVNTGQWLTADRHLMSVIIDLMYDMSHDHTRQRQAGWCETDRQREGWMHCNSDAAGTTDRQTQTEMSRAVWLSLTCTVQLVHAQDPENLDSGTIWGGNFYHTFLESWHPGVHEKSGWTCQSGSLIEECIAMATRCQILANALDDIKCHMSATVEDIWTT